MKKNVLLFSLLLPVLFLSGCSLKKPPSALQINSVPTASVFIDGKSVGKTPYQSNSLSPAELSIKLIPDSTTTPLTSWEGKIKLNPGVLTLVERDFASTDESSSGQILTLEKLKDKKTTSLSLVAYPDGTLVNIDGEARGLTPLSLETIGEGDHQISLSKEGYVDKIIKAKAVLGYKLIVNAKLAQQSESSSPTSATAAASPSPVASAAPTKSPVSLPDPEKPFVEIKETPTGWLRVRSEASTSATEVARVKPGEKYPLVEEKEDWFKIRYASEKEGWVSQSYATKHQ
ncbi:MAG: PEGA domain-containing protein [Patescibacteria group bacterium]|nr:PEGA domain-containing protein [Patescibacteria group bacterium]